MTDSALFLILSILVLGSVIATVGDRIGTRVGKARLSLFNLRPRKTAVLVTILTGLTISASTLTIIFATSEQLRIGVFRLQEVQKKLKTASKDIAKANEQKRKTESELAKTAAQKEQVEKELAQARTQQSVAQQRLDAINRSLAAALAKQGQTEAQLNQTQSELTRVASSFQQTQKQLTSVSGQAKTLRSEIQQLQAERQELLQQRNQVRAEITEFKAKVTQRDQKIAQQDRAISQRDEQILKRDQALVELDEKLATFRKSLSDRDEQIAQRDKALSLLDNKISQRDEVIAQRENRLKELEKQQASLEQEVATLEQYYQSYQTLRQGSLALLRGQVLAAGVFRIVEPAAARQVIEQLLREANRTAIKATQPGLNKVANERVVQITEAQVEQLINQIQDGRNYVVRVFSAGNYVQGEKQVQVFADAAPNQVVFRTGEVVATTSADPSNMTDQQIRQRIDLLLGASQFRATRAGILGDTVQVGDNRIVSLIRFIEQLKKHNKPISLKAVVAEDAYIAGPMKLNLEAVEDGEVVVRM
ncbi:DUF3084 domain-containing protein [Trichocoleus sp. DQ-U1]|uniref:DUF3084 domain-containing protein n=1 Tax=Trichocoleus sp. DQ-U1 TaxID=2933926 RepID=UPI003296FC77